MFEVYIDNTKVKGYQHRIQAVIYLIMKGYCLHCKYGEFLSDRVKIIERNEK